mgnify:CR=1 FL=1
MLFRSVSAAVVVVVVGLTVVTSTNGSASPVTLRIQSYRSGRVYIDGEVRTPGLQAINDIPMTLPEAIGRAGGYTPLADRASIAITRNGKTTIVNMPQLTANGARQIGVDRRHVEHQPVRNAVQGGGECRAVRLTGRQITESAHKKTPPLYDKSGGKLTFMMQ